MKERKGDGREGAGGERKRRREGRKEERKEGKAVYVSRKAYRGRVCFRYLSSIRVGRSRRWISWIIL